MPVPKNLTSREFWSEDAYLNVTLPARPSPGFPFERSLANVLAELAPVEKGQRVLEVGCAPGRWLVWYAERFGARVTGIEYTPTGASATRENFAAAGVDGDVLEADFFAEDLVLEPFDLLVSLGFIEHFDDLATAFARHAEFVAPGGKLVVGVPNFRGLVGLLQRWGDPAFLHLHNRAAMDPRRYSRMAQDLGLNIVAVRYINGPDPAMVRVTRRSAHLLVLPLGLWRRLRVADRVNGPRFSSYLVLIFTRAV